MSEPIRTFRQYVDQSTRAIADEFGCTLREAREAWTDASWRADWWAECLHRFAEGADFPTRLWRDLPDVARREVLRSTRCLRDAELTHRLVTTAPDAEVAP